MSATTSETFDLVIRNGTAVTPGGVGSADIGVRKGRIAQIGAIDPAKAGEVIDAAGLHVLPGVIDPQVHFREPGAEHKEDLESGTRAAVLGGVTAVMEMPNTNPTTTTLDALNDKLGRARGRAWCDIAFFVGASPDNIDQLPKLEAWFGTPGVKLFMGSSTGTLLVPDDATIRRVFEAGFRRVALHAEDEERLEERKALVKPDSTAHVHPEWRDVETAAKATRRVIALARETGRRIHVLHVTTAEEIELLAAAKDVATCEVLPQHLTFAAPEVYDRLGNYARMNPPIRDARHRDGLWHGIAQGIVDCIATDHAPHTAEEKNKPYAEAPAGMPGVQTALPVMLNHVHEGRLSLERLVDLMCAGPARVWGVARKGRIAVGYDADFTLVDLAAQRTIENARMAYKCGWTPFDGMAVTGWPMATVIRGMTVMREGELVGKPSGAHIRFLETLGQG